MTTERTEENAFLWQRNVVDKYKLVSTEDIKRDLESKALPCAVLAQNIEHDFNLGSIIRTANFFGIFNFYYYGRRKIDRRSAAGTYHYVNVVNLPTINDVKALKDKYVFVGMENNTPNTVPMKDFVFARNSCLIFGEEQMGIDNAVKELCDHLVELPARGSVRSINVGAAAAIAINHYVNQYTNT
jgi:tRNA G18 (ribose-2'-O)-methylase SpoU